jgi:membrane-bound lytic murein transglycosylase D
MKKFLMAVMTVCCTSGVFAQDYTENDTLSVDSLMTGSVSEILLEENQVSSEIDSMLSLWYVKNTINSEEVTREMALDTPVYFNDSVYESVLKNIPTTFPLVYNQKVKDWIEMYLRRGKYLIPTFLGLSKYYFPKIEQVLDQYGIPLELKYLTIVESALNPLAVSRTGATGLWQFMYGTGRMYGLEVTTLIDDRRDPDKETIAAAQFLKDLYSIYGDWALVIAAYNCGPGNVNRAIKRSGGKTSFWEIYQYLPKETRGYVPAFISVNYIMNNYEAHGYKAFNVNMPQYSDTVLIKDKLHFGQIAGMLGVSVDELRSLNPQYKKDIIPGNIKQMSLRLPGEYATKFAEVENDIYKYHDSVYFSPQKNLEIARANVPVSPAAKTAHAYTPEPCDNSVPAGSSKLTYTVKQGDTFGFIATWYGVKVAKLKCWNNISRDRLNVGQKLTVYVPTKRLNSYKNIDNMTFAQKQAQQSNQIVAQSNTTGKKLDSGYEYYTIRKGDNLSTIAAHYPGISGNDIMKINGFTASDVRRLQIGQVIKIRKK